MTQFSSGLPIQPSGAKYSNAGRPSSSCGDNMDWPQQKRPASPRNVVKTWTALKKTALITSVCGEKWTALNKMARNTSECGDNMGCPQQNGPNHLGMW